MIERGICHLSASRWRCGPSVIKCRFHVTHTPPFGCCGKRTQAALPPQQKPEDTPRDEPGDWSHNLLPQVKIAFGYQNPDINSVSNTSTILVQYSDNLPASQASLYLHYVVFTSAFKSRSDDKYRRYCLYRGCCRPNGFLFAAQMAACEACMKSTRQSNLLGGKADTFAYSVSLWCILKFKSSP